MELLPNDWEKWWKSEDTKLVHFIGKDNIVFHCIVFPSMLKAYGDGFIMPENVPANEFLNLEGDKISTSRGWAVWANEYLEDFPGKQDVMRYVLTANAPETKDNDFSWKDFQSRNNSELVAIFGNFVNRAVVLTHKYFRGVVPPQGQLQDIDRDVLAQLPELKISIDRNIENYRFRDALRDAMSMARIGNKYISDTEPWKVAKTDIDRTATILNICLQICASLSVVFEPFTPFAAARLRTMLDVPLDWSLVGRSDILKAGHTINTPELLFEKIEDDQIQAQLDRLKRIREQREADAKAQEASEVAAQKKTITFEDFDAMDIRTATVLEAQKVPKTDKLLKLTIDTGIDTRVIVSGIAEYYSPEEMIVKQICILANLAPRTIRGIESKGMILMARQSDGKMRFITPAEALANGAQVG